MKKYAHQFMWITIFYIACISLVHADQQTETQIKILPFIEADGELDSGKGDELLAWATPEKVIFGTYVNSHFSDPSCNSQNPRSECKKPTFEKTKILMVFDISTKQTTFNIKNEFQESQLELFNQKLFWDDYSCPYEKKIGSKSNTTYLALKPKDGCIKEIADDKNVVHKYSYVRPDGKNFFILERQFHDEIRFWSWIDWLKMYLLRTSVTYSTTTDGKGGSYTVSSPSSFILLSPNTGKFSFIDVGENSFSGATVTRAGVIAELGSYTNIPKEKQGLTLIHENQRYKIAEEEFIGYTAVSPDGCHVAYLASRRVKEIRNGYNDDIDYSKLRVIDVCEGFGVARDANPFISLLK
ncbi:MAG: hypothetical protein ACAH07_09610 [Methylophilaceae bacterium]|nr:hypothetical protein [Methyloradius sp.]